ncbi:MAG TPA: hypothetical protein VK921_15225 [Anditalea sp.]|nr:hypothetical protein [Anditalea sp.]
MKNAILILSFLLLGCYSCDKKDDILAPPITAENTFSCKIDGELFVPKEHSGFIPGKGEPIVVTNSIDNNYKIVLGDGSKDIYIHLYNLDGIGNYDLSTSNGDNFFVGDEFSSMEFKKNGISYNFVSSEDSGNIEILLFEPNKKIIFQFDEIKLFNPGDPNHFIMFTDGKLNINLETLYP